MRKLAIASTIAFMLAGHAAAQDTADAKKAERDRKRAMKEACDRYTGIQRMDCMDQFKGGGAPAGSGGSSSSSGGVSAADGKLFNDTNAAANAKVQASDFAGAAAIYQQAIDANPKSALLGRFYAGLSIALRQQAIAAYNAEQAVIPPPGASNPEIIAANKKNEGLQARKSAAALPMLHQAQEAAAKAATAAAASKDTGAEASIGSELRQTGAMLYQLDHDATLATPRASADIEAASLRKWLASEPAPPADQVARFGIGTAATLVGKDSAAALALADEVVAKAGGNADAAIGYADIVVAAKVPAGDPRRAKALAGLTAAEPAVTETSKKQSIQKLKAALGGA